MATIEEPAPTALAEVAPPAATSTEAPVSSPVPEFTAMRTAAGPITLQGAVPAQSAGAYVAAIAGNVPSDALSVADNLPQDFVPNAGLGIRALSQLSDGQLRFGASGWSLSGSADSEAQREAAIRAVRTLPGWTTDVAVTPPLELCRRHLAAFSERNSIGFQSGRAQLTEASLAVLREIAADLQNCPEVAINIEGHTDADGPAESNLVLSVARAEAVVNALIELGVNESRLYAVGYGENVPVAPNDSSAGKQANRRIVFSIAEDAS